MALTIIKIVLIILVARIIFLSIGHLIIVFYKEATKMAVEYVNKDPEKYVKDEHIERFFGNMIWLVIFINLLICVFSGKIIIS